MTEISQDPIAERQPQKQTVGAGVRQRSARGCGKEDRSAWLAVSICRRRDPAVASLSKSSAASLSGSSIDFRFVFQLNVIKAPET